MKHLLTALSFLFISAAQADDFSDLNYKVCNVSGQHETPDCPTMQRCIKFAEDQRNYWLWSKKPTASQNYERLDAYLLVTPTLIGWAYQQLEKACQ